MSMIFVLAFIQILGSMAIQLLGFRIGAILTGFLGGLVSSTATTATLARNSMLLPNKDASLENLTFLCATLAMLLEALAITVFGTQNFHLHLLIIFFGPILITLLMIIFQARTAELRPFSLENTQINIFPIVKLSAFVIGIITLSKILQNIFGQSGLIGLTFIASLFEIHGSIIANTQLHDTGGITVSFLGGLLSLSITASYISKLFLVATLGSPSLKTRVTQSTLFLFLSLTLSWLIFSFLN